jgi:hypothetical protein
MSAPLNLIKASTGARVQGVQLVPKARSTYDISSQLLRECLWGIQLDWAIHTPPTKVDNGYAGAGGMITAAIRDKSKDVAKMRARAMHTEHNGLALTAREPPAAASDGG